MTRWRPPTLLVAAALVLLPTMLVQAAQVVTVTQARRLFSVSELWLRRGDTVRFQNGDAFLHHVGADARGFSFNSGEQEPGQAVEVRFPVAGQFTVRCEIHPRMLLTVNVE